MSYILLSSAKNDQASTRSFKEFSSVGAIARRIIGHYEEWLEFSQGEGPKEYSSDDLFNFMDEFYGEMVCLKLDDDMADLWLPYSTSWIKQGIYAYLRELSGHAKKFEELSGAGDCPMSQ